MNQTEPRMIYFDNAATTLPDPAIVGAVRKKMDEIYGNPSSLHAAGIAAEREIKRARRIFGELLSAEEEEIFFTSGGTEANNMAVLGIARACGKRGNHIVTTAAEHPSVLETVKHLEKNGFIVSILPVSENGSFDMRRLEEAIRPETVLISMMHVNNETGVVSDIEQIGKHIREIRKDLLFHVDGVQGFAKHTVSLRDVDAYSTSAHKIHGEKGSGALYVKKGTPIVPVWFGGDQQKSLRPGTENVYGIVSFAAVAEKMFGMRAQYGAAVLEMKNRLLGGLRAMENVFFNGDPDNGSSYIINASFTGAKAEVLLNSLSAEGICVSTGSACAERKKSKTVLHAYGLSPERIESALRFSFSHLNTIAEVDGCLEALRRNVGLLRKFSKR